MIDRDHPLNVVAWRDGCLWALEHLSRSFTEATGISLDSETSALGAWIDKETGFSDARLEAFVEWWSLEVWGRDLTPSEYLDALAERGSQLENLRKET